MTKAELLTRTKAFALRILQLVDHLPRTTSGRAIGNQLVRSGTSVGANYRAACRARSRAEFIARINIALEEADESAFWLEIIGEGALSKSPRCAELLDEADQLCAILAASSITASEALKRGDPDPHARRHPRQ